MKYFEAFRNFIIEISSQWWSASKKSSYKSQQNRLILVNPMLSLLFLSYGTNLVWIPQTAWLSWQYFQSFQLPYVVELKSLALHPPIFSSPEQANSTFVTAKSSAEQKLQYTVFYIWQPINVATYKIEWENHSNPWFRFLKCLSFLSQTEFFPIFCPPPPFQLTPLLFLPQRTINCGKVKRWKSKWSLNIIDLGSF